jgi:general secretion pathway protein D
MMKTLLGAALLAALPLLGSAADEPANRAVAPAKSGESMMDLADLVARVRKKTGLQFILDPNANTRVWAAGFDVDRVDYPMLSAILRYNGLVTFAEKEVVSILPERDARQLPMPTLTADDPKMSDEQLVTRLMQPRNVCTAHLVPILRPLMPQFAHLAAYPYTNMLIITDRVDNVRRIADLVERFDKAATSKQECGAGKSSS